MAEESTKKTGTTAMIGILFGIAIFACGMMLMWVQWQIWQKDSESAKSRSDQRYYYRKFRRRTLIGSMIAIVGAMLTAYFYAEDPRVRATMVGGALLILLVMLGFALVDAASVYVFMNHGRDAGVAQKKLAQEYKQMRDKAAQQDSVSDDDPG